MLKGKRVEKAEVDECVVAFEDAIIETIRVTAQKLANTICDKESFIAAVERFLKKILNVTDNMPDNYVQAKTVRFVVEELRKMSEEELRNIDIFEVLEKAQKRALEEHWRSYAR